MVYLGIYIIYILLIYDNHSDVLKQCREYLLSNRVDYTVMCNMNVLNLNLMIDHSKL